LSVFVMMFSVRLMSWPNAFGSAKFQGAAGCRGAAFPPNAPL
jgi:hypothetical protein